MTVGDLFGEAVDVRGQDDGSGVLGPQGGFEDDVGQGLSAAGYGHGEGVGPGGQRAGDVAVVAADDGGAEPELGAALAVGVQQGGAFVISGDGDHREVDGLAQGGRVPR